MGQNSQWTVCPFVYIILISWPSCEAVKEHVNDLFHLIILAGVADLKETIYPKECGSVQIDPPVM